MNKNNENRILLIDDSIILSTNREEKNYCGEIERRNYGLAFSKCSIQQEYSTSGTLMDIKCWDALYNMLTGVFDICVEKVKTLLNNSSDEDEKSNAFVIIEGWNGNYFVGKLENEILKLEFEILETELYARKLETSEILNIQSPYFSYRKIATIDEWEFGDLVNSFQESISRIYYIAKQILDFAK